MPIYTDDANCTNPPASPSQTAVLAGPFSSVPERLSSTREGRRLLQQMDLDAGEIAGRQILTRGAQQAVRCIYGDLLDERATYIIESGPIVNREGLSPMARQEMSRSANVDYAELDIALRTIARTGSRAITTILERPLATSRSGSLLDKLSR
jgi:hypothetical protein